MLVTVVVVVLVVEVVVSVVVVLLAELVVSVVAVLLAVVVVLLLATGGEHMSRKQEHNYLTILCLLLLKMFPQLFNSELEIIMQLALSVRSPRGLGEVELRLFRHAVQQQQPTAPPVGPTHTISQGPTPLGPESVWTGQGENGCNDIG